VPSLPTPKCLKEYLARFHYLAIPASYQGHFAGRHNGGCNFTFFDGHAKWMKLEKATERDSCRISLRYFTRTQG
jgi:prepilin-type processing-associated H-X9-DG protein